MEILQILVDGQGWFYSKDGPITVFEKNGEMASVEWYCQHCNKEDVDRHFNGKYVIEVVYVK